MTRSQNTTSTKAAKEKKRVEEQISLSLNTEIRVICACTNKTRKLSQNKLILMNDFVILTGNY